MARTAFAQNGLVRLGYEVQGDAKPVVLVIHGLLASRASFHPLMDALEDRASVIAMDVRGHGGSSAIHGVDMKLTELASDAFAVLDAVGVNQSVVVVGVELGAVIAASMHAAQPNRISGTVLVNYPSAAMLDADTLNDIAMRAYREQVDQALSRWLDLSWGVDWQQTVPRSRVAAANRSAQAIHPILTALAAANLTPIDSVSLPGGGPFEAEEDVASIVDHLSRLLGAD